VDLFHTYPQAGAENHSNPKAQGEKVGSSVRRGALLEDEQTGVSAGESNR